MLLSEEIIQFACYILYFSYAHLEYKCTCRYKIRSFCIIRVGATVSSSLWQTCIRIFLDLRYECFLIQDLYLLLHCLAVAHLCFHMVSSLEGILSLSNEFRINHRESSLAETTGDMTTNSDKNKPSRVTALNAYSASSLS